MTDFEQRFAPSLRPLYQGLSSGGLSDAQLDGGCSSILYSASSSASSGRFFSNDFQVIESCELFQAVTAPPSGRSFESVYRRWSGENFPWTIGQAATLQRFDGALRDWRRAHPSASDADRIRFIYEWPFDSQGLGMRYRLDTPERNADQAIAAREGDCSEFTMTYLALGARAGLPVYPVWVSRDNQGDRFLHLAVAVDLGGRTYFFDPAYDPQKNSSLPARAGYDPLLPGHQAFARVGLREVLGWYWNDAGSNLSERGRALLDPAQQGVSFNSALNAFERAAQIDPYNPWIFANRGTLRRYRGESTEARADFLKALVYDSTNPQALAGLGDLHYQRAEYGEAVRRYRGALQADPSQSVYREYLVRSLVRAGRVDEARREFALLPSTYPQYSALRGLLQPSSR